MINDKEKTRINFFITKKMKNDITDYCNRNDETLTNLTKRLYTEVLEKEEERKKIYEHYKNRKFN